MANLRYSNPANWIDIEKQSIFEAWVPIVSDRPIDIFVPYPEDQQTPSEPTKGFLTNVIEDDSAFNMHNAVIELRKRKVVVLTRDDHCQDEYEEDILVAKISTVKDWMRTKPWYQDVVAGRHQWFVHLPEHITKKESYINMSQVMTIGKKLLIEKRGILNADLMELVESRYIYGIALGIIKQDSVAGEDESAVNE